MSTLFSAYQSQMTKPFISLTPPMMSYRQPYLEQHMYATVWRLKCFHFPYIGQGKSNQVIRGVYGGLQVELLIVIGGGSLVPKTLLTQAKGAT